MVVFAYLQNFARWSLFYLNTHWIRGCTLLKELHWGLTNQSKGSDDRLCYPNYLTVDPKPSLLSAKEIPLFTGQAPSWLSSNLVYCLEGFRKVCHSWLHKGNKASVIYHCRGVCPNYVRFSDNSSSLCWESFWNEDTLSSETEGTEVNFPFSRWRGPSVNMGCTF